MEEGFPAAEEPEPYELSLQERRDVEADLEDLGKMHDVFSPQGVKGVVIACQDCGQNHFYEWDLLQDNLEHMLDAGEPRMHEPAFNIHEDEYIQWDYGKGYVDALADAGLQTGRTIEVTQCPWCGTPFDAGYQYCPRCGRQLGAIRLYQELLDRGIEDREARAMLARAGYEPF